VPQNQLAPQKNIDQGKRNHAKNIGNMGFLSEKSRIIGRTSGCTVRFPHHLEMQPKVLFKFESI
jgi:hypothetical protein